MRHVCDALLAVVDGLDDCRSQLLEEFGKLMLFVGSFATGGTGLSGCLNAAIGVEATDRAVAFLEDASAFFEKGLDLVDELFFVKLFLGSAIGFFDVLDRMLVND